VHNEKKNDGLIGYLVERGMKGVTEDPRETRERERNQARADQAAQRAAWADYISSAAPARGSLDSLNLKGLNRPGFVGDSSVWVSR
jgi:hypothetical protein